MQQERLAVNRTLGDRDGIAAASNDIGQIRLGQATKTPDERAFRDAAEALSDSYGIFPQTGRPDRICTVGVALGRLMVMARPKEHAREILARSVEGFRRLGRISNAERTEAILRQVG